MGWRGRHKYLGEKGSTGIVSWVKANQNVFLKKKTLPVCSDGGGGGSLSRAKGRDCKVSVLERRASRLLGRKRGLEVSLKRGRKG